MCHAEEVDQGHRRWFLATRKAQFVKDLMDNSVVFFQLVYIFVVWATVALCSSNTAVFLQPHLTGHQSGKGLMTMHFKEMIINTFLLRVR